MDYLCYRDLSKMQVGDCRYTILTDEQGLIMSDPVALFVDSDTIWLSHGNVDLTLWAARRSSASPSQEIRGELTGRFGQQRHIDTHRHEGGPECQILTRLPAI